MQDSAARSPSRYDVARQSLRDLVTQSKDRVREEREALNALPGYREALALANSSEDARLKIIELTPQVAAIQGDYAARRGDHAASERLTTIFATLDTSDIRRLFREVASDEEPWLVFPSIYNFIKRSKNTQAVVPLIERLQNPMATRPQRPLNSLVKRLNYAVARHTIPQIREVEENYCISVRRSTLRVLGELQDPRAESAIRPFLNDTDAKVREAAQEALSRLSQI